MVIHGFLSPESLVDLAQISAGLPFMCGNYSLTLPGTESSEAANPPVMFGPRVGMGHMQGGLNYAASPHAPKMKRSSASCRAPVAYLHLRSLSCPSVLHGPRSFCSWTRPIAGQSDVVPLPKRHPLPHSGCRCRWGNMSRSKRSSSVATGHGLVVSISRWASSTFGA